MINIFALCLKVANVGILFALEYLKAVMEKLVVAKQKQNKQTNKQTKKTQTNQKQRNKQQQQQQQQSNKQANSQKTPTVEIRTFSCPRFFSSPVRSEKVNELQWRLDLLNRRRGCAPSSARVYIAGGNAPLGAREPTVINRSWRRAVSETNCCACPRVGPVEGWIGKPLSPGTVC